MRWDVLVAQAPGREVVDGHRSCTGYLGVMVSQHGIRVRCDPTDGIRPFTVAGEHEFLLVPLPRKVGADSLGLPPARGSGGRRAERRVVGVRRVSSGRCKKCIQECPVLICLELHPWPRALARHAVIKHGEQAQQRGIGVLLKVAQGCLEVLGGEEWHVRFPSTRR